MVNVTFVFNDGTHLKWGNLNIPQIKKAINQNIDQYVEELLQIKLEW